jgi:hypothetical protein
MDRARLAAASRRLAAPAIDLVRTGPPVAWTPDWMGFGNHALLWFWAWRGRAHGEPRSVLKTSAMRPWLELFPEARALTRARADVGFRSRRLIPGHIPGDGGVPAHTPDWTTREMTDFVSEAFLSSRRFGELMSCAGIRHDDLVVNVRRGDYYRRGNDRVWGFDQAGYVRAAFAVASAHAPVQRVVVVSDDVAWCSRELTWPSDPRLEVRVVPATDGPARNLATLTSARRLVTTNSTFSYWGGFIGDVMHGANRQVIAPAFFNRLENHGRAWLLDPAWTELDEPTGGWPA